MIASASTVLNAPAALIWEQVQRPAVMQAIAAPLISFTPVHPARFPDRWATGPYAVSMRLCGLIPLGQQTIGIEFPAIDGPDVMRLRDNGHGAVARKWDHHIVIRARTDGRTDYADSVTIDAGWRTPFVWAFAQIFYRHRQRRWHRLVAENFRSLENGT